MGRATVGRLGRAVLAVAAAGVLAPAPAVAKDLNGKFGLGFTQTLAGVSGVHFRYWITRAWGLETAVGLSLITRDQNTTATDLDAAVAVLYSFVQRRQANLSVGLRVDLGFRSAPEAVPVRVSAAFNQQGSTRVVEADDVILQVAIEIPFQVEFFPSDNFAIHLAVGFTFSFVPTEGNILDTGVDLKPGEFEFGFGKGGILGSAGFTFYF